MSEHSHDSQLDRQLRNVPLPADLLQRLRAAGNWSDDELDQELLDVALPPGLMNRLYQVGQTEGFDDELRDVPLPGGLLARLKNIPALRRPSRWTRVAIAASLMLVVGGAYLTSLAAVLVAVRPKPERDAEVALPYDGPLEIQSRFEAVQLEVLDVREVVRSDPEPPSLQDNIELVSFSGPPPLGPVGQLAEEFQDPEHLQKDILLMKYRLLGARQVADDELPALELPPQLPRGGVEPPLLRFYNRRFLLQHGVHPIVSPAAHPQLRSIQVPLSTRTDSYDAAVRRVAAGRLPDPAAIRVEDFVSAVSEGLKTKGKGPMAVQISGGPSQFGKRLGALASELGVPASLARQPASLLHFSLASHQKLPRESGATHVTVALDTSASMRWADRLDLAKRAIRQLLSQLAPNDRLTLIVFNEQIVQQVDSLGQQGEHEVLELLAQVSAGGGTNLSAALQFSVATALGDPWQPQAHRKLVVITDGRVRLPQETQQRAAELLSFASQRGLSFSVLELNEEDPVDPVWAELAEAGRGRVLQTLNPQRVPWALVELFSGKSSLTATDVSLQVTFRPQVVLAYRLFGHEAVGMAGLQSTTLQCDLHSGQSTGGLYEVWLKPGTDDTLGWVDVKWRAPDTGRMQRIRRRISRSEFATTFADSSPGLQAAALAAETAEILRRSPFVEPRTRSLHRVFNASGWVSSELSKHGNFQEFQSFVRKFEAVRTGRD